MKQILLDTNAILRFLLNDIPEQNKKINQLLRLSKNGKLLIIVPEVVIFETYYSLKTYYDYPKGTLVEVMESLVSSRYFQIESLTEITEALKIYKNENLSLIDSFLFAKSAKLGVELFTFDKKLNKYAKNS